MPEATIMDQDMDESNQNRSLSQDDLLGIMMTFPRKFNIMMRAMTSYYLRDSRIKPHHLMLIKAIGHGGGVSQKDLADNLPFDKSYISTGVRDLIDMGLVRNDSEGKVHKLRLTEPGRDMASMSDMMFDLINLNLSQVVDPDERIVFFQAMLKVDSRMDEIIKRYTDERWLTPKLFKTIHFLRFDPCFI